MIQLKNVDVINMSNNRIQLRLWGKIYLLELESDEYKAGFLRLLSLLDGAHDEAAIIAGAGLPEVEVRNVLGALHNMSLTETAPAPLPAASPELPGVRADKPAVFRVFESSSVRSTAECERRVREQPIALLGEGHLCEALHRLLPDYGFARVRRYPAERFADTESRDVLVLALDGYDGASLLTELNAAAVERGQTLMPIGFDDAVARIGPTVVPGKTACLACLDQRVLSNIDNHEAFAAYRDYLQETGRRYPHVASHFVAIGVFAAHELLRVVSGYELAQSYNATLKIDLYGGEVTRSRVLKFPSCGVCSSRARGLRYDNYAFSSMLSRL
jgi:bacteriocin biosynthesis cyclodehydratase domain-containing protein